MSPPPPTYGPVWRWGVASLVIGMVIGGAVVWWGMRRQVASEARRLAGIMMAEASGPRVPPRPGRLSAAKQSGAEELAGPSVPVTSDLRDAFRALMRIGEAGQRQEGLERLMHRLDPSQWVELLIAFNHLGATGEFEDDPGALGRSMGLMEEMFAQMALIDPKAALEAFRESPGQGGQWIQVNEAFEKLMGHWAARDLPAALAYHRGLATDDPAPPGTASLVRAYMQVQPESALAWAAGFPSENVGYGLQQGLSTLARRDPQRARDLLVGDFWAESFRSNRTNFAQQLASTWAEQAPGAAFDWAKSLPPEVRAPGLEGAMGAWIREDSAAAIEAMRALPPDQRTGPINAAMRAVSPDNIAAVMGVAAEMPGAATLDTQALSSASLRYRELHPEEAAEWLQSLPAGSVRDHAIKGFVGGDLGESDPEAAASWSAAASDPELRGSLLDSALNSWIFLHPDEARRWLETTDRLSNSDRTRLLERLDR